MSVPNAAPKYSNSHLSTQNFISVLKLQSHKPLPTTFTFPSLSYSPPLHAVRYYARGYGMAWVSWFPLSLPLAKDSTRVLISPFEYSSSNLTNSSQLLSPSLLFPIPPRSMWFDMVWCGSIWFDMVWCGSIWFDVVRCGSIWFDVVRYGLMFNLFVLVLFTACIMLTFTSLVCYF